MTPGRYHGSRYEWNLPSARFRPCAVATINVEQSRLMTSRGSVRRNVRIGRPCSFRQGRDEDAEKVDLRGIIPAVERGPVRDDRPIRTLAIRCNRCSARRCASTATEVLPGHDLLPRAGFYGSRSGGSVRGRTSAPGGQDRLLQKTRMAVPSPKAAAVPRISGPLHAPPDSRPAVAAHGSRTAAVDEAGLPGIIVIATSGRGPEENEAPGRMHQALGRWAAAGAGTAIRVFWKGQDRRRGGGCLPWHTSTRSRSVRLCPCRSPDDAAGWPHGRTVPRGWKPPAPGRTRRESISLHLPDWLHWSSAGRHGKGNGEPR